MSDLISRLKKMSLDSKNTSIPEIQFLEKSDLTLALNRGFTELYRCKPVNPILFLAKYLEKESHAKELEKKYKEDDLKRERLENKFYQAQKKKEYLQQQEIQKEKVNQDQKDSLINEIVECKDFNLGFNSICENLKKLVNATGVYVAEYELKRKPVTEEDDENGHIHPSNTKVIRYIGYNNDHSFLHGKCLEPNQGVTYDLINGTPVQQQPNPTENAQQENPPQEQQPQAVDPNKPPENPNAAQKPEEEAVKERPINSLMIEDVVTEPRMKFFREPRLGSYLALDITYNTSMSYASLLSAIQCTKEYEEAKAQQELRYTEWSVTQDAVNKRINELKEIAEKEEEEKRKAEEAALAEQGGNVEQNVANNQENKPEEPKKEPEKPKEVPKPANPPVANIDPNAQINVDFEAIEAETNIENLEKMITEWTEEPVKLADYSKEEKKLFLCLDTMGQDRLFNDKEMEYIKKVAGCIRDSLENLEQKLLEKDRDIRIKFDDEEKKIKESEKFLDENYETQIQQYIDGYYASEEFKSKNIEDEDEKAHEGEIARSKCLKDYIYAGDFKNTLLMFDKFEFVQFSKIFQNLLYFAHANPYEINEPETNKLDWKRARNCWRNIFPYINSYNPIGPKNEEFKPIYKLNRIKENLESGLSNRDEVKNYSFTLLQLVDYILLIIKIRYDDIVARYNKVTK